jgi:hypothetical protein
MRLLLNVSLLMLAAAFPALSATPEYPLEWHWVRVEPGAGTTPWEVQQSAVARVTFSGDDFTARLFDDDNKSATGDATIILKGHIAGRQVTAIEIQVGTDATPWTLHGSIVRSRTRPSDPSNGWGEDRISLGSGAEFIGLMRMVRSGAPAGK